MGARGLSDRRLAALGALALGGLGLAAWEATLTRSSPTAHWSVLAVIAAGIAAAVPAGHGRQRESSVDWFRHGTETAWRDLTGDRRRSATLRAATAAWVVLVAATAGWDLNSFVHQAPDLPTLSRLAGDVTRHQWGRGFLFAAWLALGACLVVAGRRGAHARSGASARSEAPAQ